METKDIGVKLLSRHPWNGRPLGMSAYDTWRYARMTMHINSVFKLRLLVWNQVWSIEC